MTVADPRYQLLEKEPGLQDKRIRDFPKQRMPGIFLWNWAEPAPVNQEAHSPSKQVDRRQDTDLIFTEAASIANALKELPSSSVLHNDSQVSRGKHNLHGHQEKLRRPVKDTEPFVSRRTAKESLSQNLLCCTEMRRCLRGS